VDAATQVIFSLGPACGCVITLASYNRFRRDCQKDAVLVALANAATSIACGAVVFAILGFLAHETGAPFEQVFKNVIRFCCLKKIAVEVLLNFIQFPVQLMGVFFEISMTFHVR